MDNAEILINLFYDHLVYSYKSRCHQFDTDSWSLYLTYTGRHANYGCEAVMRWTEFIRKVSKFLTQEDSRHQSTSSTCQCCY